MKPDVKTLPTKNSETVGTVNLTTAEKARLVIHAMGLDDLGARIPGSTLAGAADRPHDLPLADKCQIDQILLEFTEALEKRPGSTGERISTNDNQAIRPKEDGLAQPGAATKDMRQKSSRKGSAEQPGNIFVRPAKGHSEIEREFRFSEEHPRVCALILANETTDRAKAHLQIMEKPLAQKTVLNLLEIETQLPAMAQNVRDLLGRYLAGK